ncbi:MAG: hypothetical protein J7K66_01555 [Anaerolineaceae bacterium]|nr:hypothetical protein [Anaerolineaceae bacterium]
MVNLLVIGSASVDTIHLKGEKVQSAGGAGMYTAMAAIRCGARVSIFSPKPDPMPAQLQPIAEQLYSWLGPVVPPQEMPHFEISHLGDSAQYLKFFFGAEEDLVPNMLPDNISKYDCVHVIPLGNAHRQHTFLSALKKRGVKLISAGTFIKSILDDPQTVHSNIEIADIFFMNEKEAVSLFGSLAEAKTKPGKILYITLGRKGSIVVQGDYQTHLDITPSYAKDPTGAGDTFCGGALANLLQGMQPIMAAQSAMLLAAKKTRGIGPSTLLAQEPPPEILLDARISLNDSRIRKISALIKNLQDIVPFNFVGDDFPPVGHPVALDYFFTSIAQQFSFWETAKGKYSQPLIARIDGKRLKGSFYLFRAYLRQLREDPSFFTPARQANLTREELLKVFRSDDGNDPMPAIDLHLEIARRYGRDMITLGLDTRKIIAHVKSSSTPLKSFFEVMDHLGGYKEDPLRKKLGLLALTLSQRPEKFFTFSKEEHVSPVIDYHLMRSCLRTGLVDVKDANLEKKLINRELVTPQEEWAVRYASYRAIEKIVAVSGKSIGAVDWFFFNARKRCPEMTEPVCMGCPIDSACAHRKRIFQPVIRTTFY